MTGGRHLLLCSALRPLLGWSQMTKAATPRFSFVKPIPATLIFPPAMEPWHEA